MEWEGEIIKLDPKLSPSENAQALFKAYTKARDAARDIPALLESAGREREYLEQMLLHAELAEVEPELRSLSRELAEYGAFGSGGPPKAPPAKKGKFYPGKGGQKRPEQPAGTVKKLTSPDGFPILIGGSAKGNERATFDLGTGMDMWLHARQIPGAHVIVKSDGREIPQRTLLAAARLAAAHSQARGTARVPVDYTLRRFVKKVKGGPPGLVTYSQEKTIRVEGTEAPAEEE